MELRITSKEQDSLMIQIQVDEDTNLEKYQIINTRQPSVPPFRFPDQKVKKFDTIRVFSCNGSESLYKSRSGIRDYTYHWEANENAWIDNFIHLMEYRIEAIRR